MDPRTPRLAPSPLPPTDQRAARSREQGEAPDYQPSMRGLSPPSHRQCSEKKGSSLRRRIKIKIAVRRKQPPLSQVVGAVHHQGMKPSHRAPICRAGFLANPQIIGVAMQAALTASDWLWRSTGIGPRETSLTISKRNAWRYCALRLGVRAHHVAVKNGADAMSDPNASHPCRRRIRSNCQES